MNSFNNDRDGRREPLEADGGIVSVVEDSASDHPRAAELPAREATICVVGLGYVGLPLAVRFAQEQYPVIGFDIDEAKIEALRNGSDATDSLADVDHRDCELRYTTNEQEIKQADYVIITVPTPIDEYHLPNLDFVENASRIVGRHISPGTTVILESTVYPGATREVVVPALEAASSGTCGSYFYVGYSPERTTPGDAKHTVSNVVKIVSGQNEEVLNDIAALYESIVDAGVHPVPSIEVAEACKAIENIQRDVNIALVNELAMALSRMDLEIDTHSVLEAAATKWNFHEYQPGLVGGHCIPVDPYYFISRAKRDGVVPELMRASRTVNESMPRFIGQLAVKLLQECAIDLRDARVLVLGLTYKPDVTDIRSSKIGGVIDYFEEFEIDVVGYDPNGSREAMTEEFCIEIQDELSFHGNDLVILATPHREFADLDIQAMAEALEDNAALLDIYGELDPDRVEAAGISYRRL